ncbi:nuclear transport factor 2 family protein [Acidovorax cavernicola]|uniref:Nuclear transport factor 2 family protein n=1 Tax=Acidovorax cavernicola TaxID=1675792 RepID=A0A9X8D8I2_9BURK|nr:nuclear transport factor 2 family protein [Acidovorax cavernicola]RIX84646.1 nuclear transport factor 2 family protein [Acidovorax cavernicola]
MPSPARLEAFIAAVEGGAHAQAIEDFYTEDATMRENQAEPRRGRSTLVAQESAVLARTESVVSTCVRPVLVNGDHVAIHWIFEFAFKDGRQMRMEEIAWQRWDGERIAEEQFFYDPAQRKPG